MAGEATRYTGESTLIRTISFINTTTFGTGSRSITRINRYALNPGKLCFIFNFCPKVVKTPRGMLSSLAFSNRCPIANTAQIFDCDAAFGAFSLFNKILGDNVVDIASKSLLFFSPLFQKPSGRLSAFRLKFAPKFSMSFAKSIDLIAGVNFTVAIGSDIDNSHINAKIISGLVNRGLRNINNNQEIKSLILKIKSACPFTRRISILSCR